MPILAPIVAAVSTALVTVGVPAAIATFAAQVVVTVGLAVGSSVLSRLLSPRQKPPGQEFEFKYGANVPLQCVYGRQKLAGHVMPPVQMNNRVIHVRNIGVGWHDAIEAVIIDGQRLRLKNANGTPMTGQWSNSGQSYQQVGFTGVLTPDYDPVDRVGDPPATPGIQSLGANGSAWHETVEFGSNVRIKFYDGRPTQTADATLTANTQSDASGAAHWTENHAGNSICRVLIDIRPDQNKNLSANPQIEFIIRGRRLWDPRKDPTYGGTGSHSRSNPATWEWSDNCALAATDYRLGLFLAGVKVFGIGTPISRIRMDSRVAAANVCDTPRPLLDDREEPMWRIAAVITNGATHRDNLQVFMDAMAGWETERGGTYRLTAGGPQTPVVAITDADLVKAPVRYRAKKALSDRYNGVEGRFADPFNAYELQDLPMRTSSADEAEDMGERRLLPMTLSQVPSETQAQHLMEIARRRQRLQATSTITVPPRLRDPEVMDTIAWSSAWHGGTSRQFMIQNPWRKNRDLTLTWGLVETSAAIWDWDPETDQLSRLTAADLPSAVEELFEVAGFAVSANYEIGEGGQRLPIFLVSWTPIADQTVDAIVVKYRPVGAADWAQVRFDKSDTLAAGEGKIAAGIQAETAYEFEADLITTPRRQTRVVAPGPVTSDPNHVVRRSQTTETVDPGGVDREALNAAMSDLMRRINARLTQIEGSLEDIGSAIQSMDAVQVDDARSTLQQVERLRAATGDALAEISDIRLVETTLINALAALGIDVEAAVGSNSAAGFLRIVAEANPDGSLAALNFGVATEQDGVSDEAAFSMVSSGGQSLMRFRADQTEFVGDDNVPFVVFDSATKTLVATLIRSGTGSRNLFYNRTSGTLAMGVGTAGPDSANAWNTVSMGTLDVGANPEAINGATPGQGFIDANMRFQASYPQYSISGGGSGGTATFQIAIIARRSGYPDVLVTDPPYSILVGFTASNTLTIGGGTILFPDTGVARLDAGVWELLLATRCVVAGPFAYIPGSHTVTVTGRAMIRGPRI